MSQFEIKAKDGMARLGRFTTEHGTVKTPLLMPVVHPGKTEIRASELVSKFGFQMVITNSYIIKSQEKFKSLALEKGVHGLLDFDGPIMTDSGTFQMYFHSLPEEEIDPLEIISFQKSIGSDIGTILDAFSDPDAGMVQASEDVQISLERARISIPKKENMLLAGTIQGGIYPELREVSSKYMADLDFDVYPIGGVVPMMERYRYADVVRAILAAKKYLPLDKPVHLFGCGHPMIFAQAALLGCDFFDSASYAKFAASGRMLLTTGTTHLDNLSELPCECPICSSMDAYEMKNLKKHEKKLALMKHNLYVTAGEIRRVRQAIAEGKLMELAAIRARGHPELFEAFQVMLSSANQLNASDPIGNPRSILYTGTETSRLPIFHRFHRNILQSYPYRNTKTLLLIPDMATTPFSETLGKLTSEIRNRSPEDVIAAFVTPIGVIPWELEHIHPAQQCVFPKTLDRTTIATVISRSTDFLQAINPERIGWVSRNLQLNEVAEVLDEAFKLRMIKGVEMAISEIASYPESTGSWGRRKLTAIFEHQWGITPDKLLDQEDLHLKISRKTGKIRHVQLGTEILFTLVPTTGLLTPTYRGGEVLLESGLSEHYIVVVDDDAAPYVAKGKSALAKFVIKASSDLLAGEEVLIVNRENSLLGTGRALLTGPEMLAFSRGVAVTPRHSKE